MRRSRVKLQLEASGTAQTRLRLPVLTDTQRHTLTEQIGIEAKHNQALALSELRQMLSPLPFPERLHLLCATGLTHLLSLNPNGRQTTEDDSNSSGPVELLQALCLQLPHSNNNTIHGTQSVASPVVAIKWAATLIEATLYRDSFRRISPQDVHEHLLSGSLAFSNAMVRGDAYKCDMMRLLLRTLRPIDDMFEGLLGIKATRAAAFLSHLTDQVTRSAARALHNPAVMAAYGSGSWAPRTAETAWSLLSMSHAEVDLEVLKFAHGNSTEVRALHTILRNIATEFVPTNEDIDVASLVANNPIRTAPIVYNRTSTRPYTFPLPLVAGHTSLPQTMRTLIRGTGNTPLWESYQKAQATCLESESAAMLRAALGDSAIVAENVKWTHSDSGKKFESDAIAVIDELLLSVEAKSSAFTPSVRSGDRNLLRRKMSTIVTEGARQTHRLLTAYRQGKLQKVRGMKPTQAAMSARYLVSIVVSMENLWHAAVDLHSLEQAGYAPEGTTLPLLIQLTDLYLICRILNRPALLAHYLIRRFATRLSNMAADEADLLGLYLDTGLRIDTHQHAYRQYINPTYSFRFDAVSQMMNYENPELAGDTVYFMLRESDSIALQLLAHLEERRPKGWLTCSVALLSIEPSTWSSLSKQCRRYGRKLLKGTRGHRVCVETTVNVGDDTIRIYFVVSRAPHPERTGDVPVMPSLQARTVVFAMDCEAEYRCVSVWLLDSVQSRSAQDIDG